MVWWKILIVDLILAKNYFNQFITTIDLGDLQFNCFLIYVIYEIQSKGESNSY